MNLQDLKPASEFAKIYGCSGVYQIRNLISNTVYVGSAINFKKRWSWHKKDLKGKRHRNSYLQYAWNKYGEQAFVFEIIEVCEKEKLIEREQYYIDLKNCIRPNGYNLNPKASNSLGIKRSDETKQKQRIKKLGTTIHPNTRAAIIKANTGKKASNKVRETTRIRSLGNTYGLGYKHSDENKLKISNFHKGKAKSEEHKRKISESLKLKNQLKLEKVILL